MTNVNKISAFLGALIVKFIFYLAVSCVFILLFWWAGIIDWFSWKYTIVLALGLLFMRIFISEIIVRPEKK